MKKLLTTAGLFVVTAVAIVSFIAPAVFGQEKKVDPLPDKSVTDRVDKLFAQWDKPDSPGCALGIVKDGRLIYKRGYGMANLDYNIPISPQSAFIIASMSKQFTAMSILLLAKQGKLSLDDEIQKHLPEIPRYQSPLTVRHLIHHTSGIRDLSSLAGLAGLAGTGAFDREEEDMFGVLARQKELNFKPGDEHEYSNTGYYLLRIIVKRVSGKSWREFADENIFKPLGMNNTHFHDDRNFVVRNRVTGYRQGSNGGFVYGLTLLRDKELYTSVEDLFLWDQNFYNNKLGGGPDLIREQVSTGMLNNGEKANYAFGLDVEEYKGLQTIGHGGSGGSGWETWMRRFPEQRFSVICLCNAGRTVSPWGLTNQVADIFLADQFKKVPEPVKETTAAPPDIIIIPEKELASLAGLYFDPSKETTVLFYMKDGKLMIFNSVLSPISQNRFKVVGAGAPLGLESFFVRPIAAGPMQMKFVRGGNTTTYYAVQSETPTSAQLTEFTGRYVSDELPGATYTLSIKDGNLILQVRNGFSDRALVVMGGAQASVSKDPKDNLLTPWFADAFRFVGNARWVVRFMRNQQNAVSGFTLTKPGARRLRFNKQ